MPQILAKIVTLSTQLGSRSAIEAAATAAVVISGLPQLLALLRGSDGRGVSIATWSVVFISGLLWGWYGLALHDGWIVATNTFVSVNAASIASLALYRRTRAKESS